MRTTPYLLPGRLLTPLDKHGILGIPFSRQRLTMGRVYNAMWACQRPLTHKWGSGQVYDRIVKTFGAPDAAFGATDNIPPGPTVIDRNVGFEWNNLPFPNNYFSFGYWDPPYDKMYKKECLEIWRVCQRLAILHTIIYPKDWLDDAIREAMVAVTMGPLKRIRCLQVFRKGWRLI